MFTGFDEIYNGFTHEGGAFGPDQTSFPLIW